MTRLGIFMSHPIQYQVSLLRYLASREGIDLTVYYYWDFGLKESYDPEFGGTVKWDLPLLEGYKHRFLKNISFRKGTNFFGCINPGAILPILMRKQDAVLVFGWALFSNWLVVLAALLSGTPILLCGESPMSHEISKSGVSKTFRRFLLKRLFAVIDGFMYIGSENRKFYQSYGVPADKLFFSPYAVDNERHYRACQLLQSSDTESSPRSDAERDSVIILFVGKLIEKKRPMDLLKAFHLLQQQRPGKPHALWFVGDGQQRNELEAYVETHHVSDVKFWGFQNQTALPRFYFSADIFVLPSGYGETWGLVVNEAMCYGKPVVVSDRVGCGSDLVTPDNGFRFPFGDVTRLVECLSILVRDDERRGKFGNKSLDIIRNFSQESAAGQVAATAKRLSAPR